MKCQRHTLAAAALAALLATQGAQAQAPMIERVKLTDNEMSCQMIYGEIKQMDAFIANAPPVAVAAAPAAPAPAADANPLGNAVTQQALAQVAARSGGLGGMFGGLLAAAAAPAAGPAQPQQAAVAAQQQNALTQQALTMAAASGKISPSSVGGLAGLMGGLSALTAAQQPAQAPPVAVAPAAAPANGLATQAQARKEHLTTLFLGKGCKLSEVQK